MSSIYSRLSQTQIISLLAISVPAIIFFDLAAAVWSVESFWWDEKLLVAAHSLEQPWLTLMIQFITFTGGLGAYLLFTTLVIWLLRQQRRKQLWLLTIGFLGGALLNQTLKLLFLRPRPALFSHLVTVGGYSFPSGHSMAGITLFGIVAIFLWQDSRYGWAVLMGIWALLVGVSRIYLGVHYPSDVLAGWMVGSLWILIAFALLHRLQPLFQLRREEHIRGTTQKEPNDR